MKKVRYHRAAREELYIATDEYETYRRGLGLDFLDEIMRAIALIRESPERWPEWPHLKARVLVRKYVVQKYPFAIPYILHGNTIVVLAIAHGKRKPGYWRARVGEIITR